VTANLLSRFRRSYHFAAGAAGLLPAAAMTPTKQGARDVRSSRPARRSLIKAISGAAVVVLGLGASVAAWAREKMTKQEAEYQESPKDIRMCSTCSLFEPPKSCKVVEGDVSPDGWCKAYAMAD
jgi:ferric-dicitrate binding protein FerR (iron transport regulator)